MTKTCCCTGHRPKRFPFKYGIDEQKHDDYLTMLGMAWGVNLEKADK